MGSGRLTAGQLNQKGHRVCAVRCAQGMPWVAYRAGCTVFDDMPSAPPPPNVSVRVGSPPVAGIMPPLAVDCTAAVLADSGDSQRVGWVGVDTGAVIRNSRTAANLGGPQPGGLLSRRLHLGLAPICVWAR